MKYYAVAKGREVGIFYDNWNNVKKLIDGFSGARYKGFKTEQQAQQWLNKQLGNNLGIGSSGGSNDSNETINAGPSTAMASVNEDNQYQNQIVIYTDGSHKNNYGGWGFVVTYNQKVIAEHYGAVVAYPGTNNQGELNAIYSALNMYPEVSVIYSDSMYSINIFTQWINGWRNKGWRKSDGQPIKNQELIILIDQLLQQHNQPVIFNHVRAHQGHVFNEHADQLANIGRPDTILEVNKLSVNQDYLNTLTIIKVTDHTIIYYDQQQYLLYVININNNSTIDSDKESGRMKYSIAKKMQRRGITLEVEGYIWDLCKLDYLNTNISDIDNNKHCAYGGVFRIPPEANTVIETLDDYIKLHQWTPDQVNFMYGQRDMLYTELIKCGYTIDNIIDDDFIIVANRLYIINFDNVYFWPEHSANN